MSVKNEIFSEVIEKLKSGGKVPQEMIDQLTNMLNAGVIERGSLTALLNGEFGDVSKNKTGTDKESSRDS